MRFLIPFLLIIIAVAAYFIISKAIESSKRRMSGAKDEYGKACELTVYNVLRTSQSHKNVFSNLYFPVDRGGEILWTETDVVCITHGGIVVIEVKGLKGTIDNPESGDWLERSGLRNVPVFNAVVFTEKNVRFTNRYKWLMRLDRISDFVCETDDRNALKKQDIKALRAVLNNYTKRREPSAAAMYR